MGKGKMTVSRMESKWRGYEFTSSISETDEFKAFARDFKRCINSIIPDGIELVKFSRGHFYCNGFLKRDDKFIYFSIPDVRYWKDKWFNNILIRSAENTEDYTGGSNGFTNLRDFASEVVELFDRLARD